MLNDPAATGDLIPLAAVLDSDALVVGGKAFGLARLLRAGLPVPQGLVLTTRFFAPWSHALRDSDAWHRLATGRDDVAAACSELQTLALELTLNRHQAATLERLSRIVDTWPGARLAVRSSSPNEDSDTASFAGVYRSSLHVLPKDVFEAIRGCFASSLSTGVMSYKSVQGLGLEDAGFAVIVQTQVPSDVAGVAFSLNPDNNDHDEMLIAAAPGPGAQVVDGTVAAEHVVVDKPTGQRLEHRLNRLGAAAAAGSCLDRSQLQTLTTHVNQVEALLGCPVDVEWAFGGGSAWLLQARPITRYFPVPEILATEPGERRQLYTDTGIDQGMTSNAPVSVMGADISEHAVAAVLGVNFGLRRPPGEGFVCFAGNRAYLPLSPLLYLLKPRRLAGGSGAGLTNTLLPETLRAVDRSRYRATRFPRRTLWAMAKVVGGALRLMGRLPLALADSGRFGTVYTRNNAELERAFRDEVVDYTLPLTEFLHRYGAVLRKVLRQSTFPALVLVLVRGNLALQRLMRNAADRERELIGRLETGLGGDQVVQMDRAIWRTATLLPKLDLEDLEALVEQVERRTAPAEFLEAWDDLLRRFGHRGPNEMDVRHPRFGDDPRLLLSYMLATRRGTSPSDAVERLVRQVAGREAAVAELMRTGPRRHRRRLAAICSITERFADARNLPKHQISRYLALVRRRLLLEGQRLVAEGLLDRPEDVFDLGLSDLTAAAQRAGGLRELCRRNRVEREFLERRVRQFPLVVDSRGRILRPPVPPGRPGELQGHGVSGGAASGPVRVLRVADAGAVAVGDVLVAYVTDPGWTPLFGSAAALVLEVGGPIQHGALLARELGLPCVVGISGVTERLRDGDWVQVDGDRGLVTVQNAPAAPPPRPGHA